MEKSAYTQLMDLALRALTRRPHTSFELQEKLKKNKVFTPELGGQVQERLKELKLLNDEEFIQRTIENDSAVRLHGFLKIAQKLHKKGIPFQKTEEVWHSLSIDQETLAIEALQRTQKRTQNLPKDKRLARRSRFLASRGFPPEIIFKLAKQDD